MLLYIYKRRNLYGYIYSITNKINNKKYIGKTEYDNPIKRWQEHLRDSERFDRPLYRAIKKYDKENFIFEILFSDLYGEELCEKEVETIQKYNTYYDGYNATFGGEGRSYISLSKEELEKAFKELKSINKVSKYFNHDPLTIKRLCKKYEIDINFLNKGYVPNGTYIYCEELDKFFPSVTEGANYIVQHKISTTTDTEMVRRGISRVINGKRKTYLKMHWKKCY